MAMTKTDLQIGTLKELVLAKHALDRSISEFANSIGIKVGDRRMTLLVQQLPGIDPREIDEETLKHVLTSAYIK